jgi:hypothetical protein
VEDLADLRAIAEAAERARRDEAPLTECVAPARAHGRSWNQIAHQMMPRRITPGEITAVVRRINSFPGLTGGVSLTR